MPKCPSQGPHLRSLLRALSCQPCPSPSLTARPLRREPGLRARQGLTAGSTRTRAAQGRQRPVPTGPGAAPRPGSRLPDPKFGPGPHGAPAAPSTATPPPRLTDPHCARSARPRPPRPRARPRIRPQTRPISAVLGPAAPPLAPPLAPPCPGSTAPILATPSWPRPLALTPPPAPARVR